MPMERNCQRQWNPVMEGPSDARRCDVWNQTEPAYEGAVYLCDGSVCLALVPDGSDRSQRW